MKQKSKDLCSDSNQKYASSSDEDKTPYVRDL